MDSYWKGSLNTLHSLSLVRVLEKDPDAKSILKPRWQRRHFKMALLTTCFFNLLAQITPYHNMKLRGVIHKTILRGNVVYERDRLCDSPAGQLLLETGQGYSSTSKI